MSLIKSHYHEEINSRQDDHVDEEYHYNKWLEEQLEQEAEKAAFFETFRVTGTYPM